MPPPEAWRSLINTYFEGFYGQPYPFFRREDFERRLAGRSCRVACSWPCSLWLYAIQAVPSRISQARANPTPPPKAGPSKQEIVTFEERSMVSNSSVNLCSWSSEEAPFELTGDMLLPKSMPVQKYFPSPVIAKWLVILSSSACLKTEMMSEIMFVAGAFLFLALFKMIRRLALER